MSTPIRKPQFVATQALLARTLLAVPLLMANACSDSARVVTAAEQAAPATETGRLQLNLTASSSGERVYRLQNATFTITGTTTGVVQEVRADAQQDRLSLELAPDRYEVMLHEDYQLELSEGGSVSRVDATLISENPAVVTIARGVVSPLDFMFRVGDGTVEAGGGTGEPGSGVLDLGIGVVDPGEVVSPEVDCSDAYEPNDDQPLATPLAPGAPLTASMCGRDLDYYRFAAPVPVGELFTVRFGVHSERFFLSSAVIDPAIVPTEPGAELVAGGNGQDDFELYLVSNGGEYALRAWMGFDPFEGEGVDPDPSPNEGLSYTVSVGEFVNTAENSCCTTSGTGGCNDDAVNACLCASNAYCCGTSYDALCVTEAILECGAQCAPPPPESDCCRASSAPGCTVSAVQACVCDINPYCCFGEFDENCAALAQRQCGAACSP